MRPFSLLLAASAILCGESPALAQGQPQQPLVPTTVQLPTFSTFRVVTTVSVPDRGGAYLGGVTRGRDGAGRGAGAASVHATIVDHHEIDAALLAEAAARRGSIPPDRATAKAEAISSHVTRGAAGESLAAARERNAERAAGRENDAAIYFSKGQQAEREGKAGVARVYYQMAARQSQGSLHVQALQKIAVLGHRK